MENSNISNLELNSSLSFALNEVMEYHNSLKKISDGSNSVYEQIKDSPIPGKKSKNLGQRIRPQRGIELVVGSGAGTFSEYSDGSYLYPIDVLIYAIFRIVFLILTPIILCLLLPQFPVWEILVATLFIYALLGYWTFRTFAMLWNSIQQLCSKKKSYYSLLKKIKFNKENKEELKSLMNGNEMLQEIFQIKYGKNIYIWNLLNYNFFFIGENGEVWYYTKENFKKKLFINIACSVVFGIIFLVILFTIPTPLIGTLNFVIYIVSIVGLGMFFVNSSILVFYWIFVIFKVLKNHKFKI